MAIALIKKIPKVKNVFDAMAGSIFVQIIAKPSKALKTIVTTQITKQTLFNGLNWIMALLLIYYIFDALQFINI
jgi:hypothetical protein